MADVFEDHPDLPSEREKLWRLIETTPNLIWQLLTKRPQNVLRMVPESWLKAFPTNVWMMTSTENQHRFDERITFLTKIPASVLGISCEPLLSAIGFGQAFNGFNPKQLWVIAGGESSHSASKVRPTEHSWFSGLRDQCQQRGIPFFFKQWGNRYEDGQYHRDKSYRLLNGREWNEYPEAIEVQSI